MTATASLARAKAFRPYAFLSLLFAALVFSAAPSSLAQSGAGSIRGQISNSATGQNLGGVTVEISEIKRTAITDRTGSFEITGLAPGTYTVRAEYPGLDPATTTVSVQEGQVSRTEIALTSEIYVLPEFAVATEREGNAAAIVAQKNAVNVQNIVTADAFGNIAKGNVGNFLKRIPGIAGTTDEVDTENIVLRGIAANFTSLDIDGTRSAGGSPDGRNQSAAAILTDMIERAEVIKATTPDVDADSLGGRINLVTKSAFDRKGRQISVRAATSYSFTYGDDVGTRDGNPWAPSVAASFSDVFSIGGGERNLGVLVSGNYERILDVRGTTAWNWGSAASNSGTIPVIPGTTQREQDFPQFNNVSVALHEQVRGGGTLRLDYRASDHLTMSGSVGFSQFQNNMHRTRNQLAPGVVNVPLSGDLDFTVIDGARYRAIQETRDQRTDKIFGRFAAKYDAPWGQIDYDLSYEKAERREDRGSINPTSNFRFNYVLDRRPQPESDPRWPKIRVIRAPYTGNTQATTTAPTTFLDINPFADDFRDTNAAPAFWRRHNTDNEVFGSKVDFTKRFAGDVPVELKTGLRYRQEITKADRDELTGDINLTTFGRDLRHFMDGGWNLGGAIGRYPVGIVPEVESLQNTAGVTYSAPTSNDPRSSWMFNPAVFTINNQNTISNSLSNDRKLWEDLSAGYLQGKVDIANLQVLGGFRVERTSVERSIPFRDTTFGSSDLRRYLPRTRASKSYTNVFPSVHFRYQFTRNLIGHASYSTTIGRPNFGDLLSAADINDANNTITIPNLDLKPQESKNYDLSIEYYFEPVGVVSVGVFQKNIEEFPISVARTGVTGAEAAEFGVPESLTNESWTVSTKVNGGDGEVRGVELNYSQQMAFLPGVWQGLGVFANFTYLETEGTFDTGTSVRTSDLENFVPRIANAGLTYAYGRFDGRLQWNYTDAFLETADLNNPLQRNKWRGQRWQLDFSGKYKVTRNLTLFADLINLSSNYGKKYRGTVDAIRREETNALGFLLTAGIQARY